MLMSRDDCRLAAGSVTIGLMSSGSASIIVDTLIVIAKVLPRLLDTAAD